MGLLCNEYNIEYSDSFQVHQDLPKTWKDHYQPGMPKHDPTFTDRDQSKDPDTCMVAVRSIAANWGLGPRFERKMSMRDTLDYHLLSKIGYKDLADGIVSGRIRTTNADLPPKVELPDPVKREEEQKMQPTPKRKRKRRSTVVKEESSDSDFAVRPPEPARKKRKRSKPKAKPQPKPKPKVRRKRKPSKKRKPSPKKRKRT